MTKASSKHFDVSRSSRQIWHVAVEHMEHAWHLPPGHIYAVSHNPTTSVASFSTHCWPTINAATILQHTRLHGFMKGEAGQRKEPPIHSLSSERALANFIKSMIGAGMLAMPLAFANGGLWMSLGICFVLGIVNMDCLHMLLRASRSLCKRLNLTELDYGDTMQAAFRSSTIRLLREHSTIGKYLVNTSLFIGQLGGCSFYFIFMADNIKQVVEFYVPNAVLSQQAFIACVLPAVLLVTFIRELKFIAPLACWANLIYIGGIGTILYYILSSPLSPTSSLPAIGSLSTLPLLFGTVMTAYKGVALVLPMEKKMKRPEELTQWNGVINVGFAVVACLNVAVGFFGYLRFGGATAGSVTLNLPQENILFQTVKLAFVIAIYVSYALNFYVPMEISMKHIQEWFSRKPNNLSERANRYLSRFEPVAEYFAKVGLVLLTFIFAIVIPRLGLFISLMGSLITSLIAIVFPSASELLTLPKEQRGRLNWRIWKDVVYFFVGIIGCVTGVYAATRDIVASFG